MTSYKNKLQEIYQKSGECLPEYITKECNVSTHTHPIHEKRFITNIKLCNDIHVEGINCFLNKKESHQDIARIALEYLSMKSDIHDISPRATPHTPHTPLYTHALTHTQSSLDLSPMTKDNTSTLSSTMVDNPKISNICIIIDVENVPSVYDELNTKIHTNDYNIICVLSKLGNYPKSIPLDKLRIINSTRKNAADTFITMLVTQYIIMSEIQHLIIITRDHFASSIVDSVSYFNTDKSVYHAVNASDAMEYITCLNNIYNTPSVTINLISE